MSIQWIKEPFNVDTKDITPENYREKTANFPLSVKLALLTRFALECKAAIVAAEMEKGGRAIESVANYYGNK